MFAYCNNDPVNASDPSGCIIKYTDENGSYGFITPSGNIIVHEAHKSKASTKNQLSKSSGSITSSTKSTVSSAAKTIGTTVGDSLIDVAANKLSKYTEEKLALAVTHVKLNKLPMLAETSGRIGGVLGLISLGTDYWQDYNTYIGWGAGKAMAIDTVGFAVGVAIAVAIGYFVAPVALGIVAAVGVGLLTGYLVDAAKDRWLRKKQ